MIKDIWDWQENTEFRFVDISNGGKTFLDTTQVRAWRQVQTVPFVVQHKLDPSQWVREGLSLRCLDFPMPLLKQHHQSSISCHSPKLRSEQIHVNRKGHILRCAFAQLDSLPVSLCQETAIPLYTPSLWMTETMRRSHMTSSNTPIPLSPELDYHLPLCS